ncbi:hypothetical protein ACSOS9_23520, partial [Tsukamurella sp. MT6.1]
YTPDTPPAAPPAAPYSPFQSAPPQAPQYQGQPFSGAAQGPTAQGQGTPGQGGQEPGAKHQGQAPQGRPWAQDQRRTPPEQAPEDRQEQQVESGHAGQHTSGSTVADLIARMNADTERSSGGRRRKPE